MSSADMTSHGFSTCGCQKKSGERDISVVSAPDCDRKVAGSSPGRSGGRVFFSSVKFL